MGRFTETLGQVLRALVLVMFVLTLGVAPLVGGIGVFAWQVIEWLSTGQWVSASMLDFMIWTDFGVSWAESPTS